MKTFILKAFFVAFAVTQIGIMAAETSTNVPQQENKWMNEVRNFKHSFLIKETEMTEEQSKEFIPLYTEMENKIYQANREARNLEQEITHSQNETINEDKYFTVAAALSQVKTKEAEIENHYFTLFSNILNKKQLFLLKRAENRFAFKMLSHNKRSKKTNNQENK